MFENIGFQISQHVKTVLKSKRLFAIHFMKIQHFLSNLALKIIICEHAESMFLRGKVSNVKKKNVLHFIHRIYSFIFYTYICIGMYMLKWNLQIKMLNNANIFICMIIKIKYSHVLEDEWLALALHSVGGTWASFNHQ